VPRKNRRQSDASQGLLIDLDPGQIDDPILRADVGRLHRLEEIGLRRRIPIRLGDRDGREEGLRLGDAELDPGAGDGLLALPRRDPRLE
jgi:hypothetical protein